MLLEVVIYPGSGLLTGVQIFLGLCEISRFLGLGQIGLSRLFFLRKIRKSLKVLQNKNLVCKPTIFKYLSQYNILKYLLNLHARKINFKILKRSLFV